MTVAHPIFQTPKILPKMKKINLSDNVVYVIVFLAIAVAAILAAVWMPQLNAIMTDGSGYKPL